ncbi:hypothetical protein [Mycobacterium lepromatosis]|uniref:hypothetical protein n=1 Tax=Mycobacterium lepromatosis TaxID=480418 RepID=UPI000B102950|nr:hypothetical protein [Mycobacterium lepromatosis]
MQVQADHALDGLQMFELAAQTHFIAITREAALAQLAREGTPYSAPATPFTLLIPTENSSPHCVRDSLPGSIQSMMNARRESNSWTSSFLSYPPSPFEPMPRTQSSTGHRLTGGVQHVTLGALLDPRAGVGHPTTGQPYGPALRIMSKVSATASISEKLMLTSATRCAGVQTNASTYLPLGFCAVIE